MKKTEEKEAKKFWTFATQVPFEVKESLDMMSRADYKQLVEKIRGVLREAADEVKSKNGSGR